MGRRNLLEENPELAQEMKAILGRLMDAEDGIRKSD